MALEMVDYEKWRKRKQELGDGERQADRDRDRLDARLGHQQLRPGADHQPGPAVLGQRRGGDTSSSTSTARSDVNLGTTPQGQGHETTAAQVVADVLGMDPADVNVTAGFDQRHNTYVAFSGTYASQFAVTGLGAALGAAEKLREEISLLLRSRCRRDEEEIELADGNCAFAATAERAIPFIGIANLAYSNNAVLAAGARRPDLAQLPPRIHAAVPGARRRDEDRRT